MLRVPKLRRWAVREVAESSSRERVNSVPLVRRGVPLAIKHVAEMPATVRAHGLQAARRCLHRDVATLAVMVTFIKSDPSAVVELGRRGVQRQLTAGAREISRLGEEAVVFAGTGALSAGLAEDTVTSITKNSSPLCVRLLDRPRHLMVAPRNYWGVTGRKQGSDANVKQNASRASQVASTTQLTPGSQLAWQLVCTVH